MFANANNRSPDGAFEITRTFKAPRDLVWKAWSEPARLQAWWGPKGCKIKVAKLEFRPGGFFHYAMQYSNGPPMWGRFLFREIAAPERIVWLNSFSNETCGVTRAPFGQPFPLEMQNTVTLTEREGMTTITLRASPHGETEEERNTFEGMFASLAQGYGGTFEQLSDYLNRS